MNPPKQALKVALAAVEKLPRNQQKVLAERLIASTMPDENTITLFLRRLSPKKQKRLGELMDKNNDGRLNRAERLELEHLGLEVDQMLLANSQAMARALRPELFGNQGRLIKRRFRQRISEPTFRHSEPKSGNGRR